MRSRPQRWNQVRWFIVGLVMLVVIAAAPFSPRAGTAYATDQAAQITPAELTAAAEGSVDRLGSPGTVRPVTLAALLPRPQQLHPEVIAALSAHGALSIESLGSDAIAARDALSAASHARAEANAAATAIVAATEARNRLIRRVAATEIRESERIDALAAADERVRELSIGLFIENEAAALDTFLSQPSPELLPTLADSTGQHFVALWRDAQDALRWTQDALDRRRSQLAAAEAELVRLHEIAAAAHRREADAVALAQGHEAAIEARLLTLVVPSLGFSVVTLDAYFRASVIAQTEWPRCGVRWDQLAGIGAVESRHGTVAGGRVHADGTVSVKILGPVLDGTEFAAIADTDGGHYDGDTEWDRAVGPMQFIPGSWVRFGGDGNFDGLRDPHNIYDAAVAAANHLCATTSGLDRPEQYRAALLGYNRSVEYGAQVAGLAQSYRQRFSLELTEPTEVWVTRPLLLDEALSVEA